MIGLLMDEKFGWFSYNGLVESHQYI